MGAPFAELSQPLEQTTLLCRGCLAASGEMKDMFEWGLAEDFSKTTFIQIDQTEVLSRLLCSECEDKLESCKRFQTQCAQSDDTLRRLAKSNKETLTPQFQGEDNATSCLMYDNRLIMMITAADTKRKIYLPCPYECAEKFLKKHDLFQHLVKTHQADKESFAVDLQYYCHHQDCSYHPLSKANKWFAGRKFLNQHFNKVHRSKIFSCNACKTRFPTHSDFSRHLKACNVTFACQICDAKYEKNERLLVHLKRRHPDQHKQYKMERQASKRRGKVETETIERVESEKLKEFMCDSPKRSFATQTTSVDDNIRNDVSLWNSMPSRGYFNEAKTDEISTQTVFEDLLSIKSQTSEDESIFFSETVSLSDIQTQTFPLEFGLSRSNKETVTCQTQSPDLSMKETQTCICLYDSPRQSVRLFDSVSSSPSSLRREGQSDDVCSIKSDVLLSSISAQTQTYFNDGGDKDNI